jgi:hypothetical protein
MWSAYLFVVCFEEEVAFKDREATFSLKHFVWERFSETAQSHNLAICVSADIFGVPLHLIYKRK